MFECVIVGGGVIGMMTALELANAGARVLLVERGDVGRESSWAGGGILCPLYPWQYPAFMMELVFWSQEYYPDLSVELRQKTGVDPELIRSGMLILDDKEVEQGLAWGKTYSIEVEKLDKNDLARRFPRVNQKISDSALWLRDVYQIRNPRLVKALRKILADVGVETRLHSPVTKIRIHHGRVEGVSIHGDRINSQIVVVASGAWSSVVMGDLPRHVDVVPIRGQMLLLRGQAGFIAPIVSGIGQYIIPRRDGHILVGSTLEDVGFDKRTTEDSFRTLYTAALTLIPELVDWTVEKHWAGLRPGSKGGVPIISEVPEVKGLFVNTGHHRNGLLLAPASAKLMAELIQGHSPTLDPCHFQLQ